MPKKNSKFLTDPGIAKISKAPRGKRAERFDAGAPGLALRITDRGVKSWSVYYRLNGAHKRMTIGRWPEVGVAQAREQAIGIKDQARAGIDPKGARETEKATESEADEQVRGTFGTIAELYIKRECSRLKRGWEVERIIRRELMPTWHTRLMADLRKRDAIKLTDALVDAGKPAAAHRLFEITRRVGRWAVRRDEIDLNPFADMEPPADKVMRDRYLKPHEIEAVWEAWDAMGYPFGPLGKMLLTTAQRLNEVAQMQWSEIDRDKALWIIPGERTKNTLEMEVPLSSLALDILDALPRFTDDDTADDGAEFVFTTTSGRRPVSGFSKMKARTDTLALKISQDKKNSPDVGSLGSTARASAMRWLAKLPTKSKRPKSAKPMPPWRLHDLRRTARTGLAELGVPQIVAEKVLNHAERNVLVKTYDRHEYAAEKRDALERWANRLREITEPPPENVVKLTVKR